MSSRRFAFAAFASVVLVGLGGKLHWLRKYGAEVPFWDEWDAELGSVLLPYESGSLGWREIFAAHNEHRHVWTKLLVLGLRIANMQWDPFVTALVNAFIHCFSVALLLWLLAGQLDRPRLLALCGLSCVVLAGPYGWENTLGGFQSPFYFLLLFTAAGLWLLTAREAITWRWWLGAGFLTAGLVNIGSGVIAPTAMILFSISAVLFGPSTKRYAIVTASACALLVAGGLALYVEVQGHAQFRAHGIGEFLLAFLRTLSWPFIPDRSAPGGFAGMGTALLGAGLVSGPLFALLGVGIRRPPVLDDRALRYAFVISAWVVLHAAAIASARGTGGAFPSWRYNDILSVGLFADAFVLLHLTASASRSALAQVLGLNERQLKKAVAVFGIAWTMAVAAGLAFQYKPDLQQSEGRGNLYRIQTANTALFVLTGDKSHLDQPFLHIPYPDAHTLMSFLQRPEVRRILPADLHKPLPFTVLSGRTESALLPAALRDRYIDAGFPVVHAKGQEPIELEVRMPRGMYARFQVAGAADTKARIRVLGRNGTVEEERDLRLRGGAWTPLLLRSEDEPLRLEVQGENNASVVALKAPVPMGPLSVWASRVVQADAYVFLAGLLAAAAAVFLAYRNARARKS